MTSSRKEVWTGAGPREKDEQPAPEERFVNKIIIAALVFNGFSKIEKEVNRRGLGQERNLQNLPKTRYS